MWKDGDLLPRCEVRLVGWGNASRGVVGWSEKIKDKSGMQARDAVAVCGVVMGGVKSWMVAL
jgi:hypothetical protein